MIAPRSSSGGLKMFLKMRADKLLDWYAMQARSLRIGLLGSVAAFGFMGAVVAASNALVPMPNGSNWATVPETPATSMAVRITGSSGPTPTTEAPSATAAPTAAAQLPSASETPSSSPHVTGSINATHKASNATMKSSKATKKQETESTTKAPHPTKAEPTTAPPTDPPTTDPSTTDPAPSPTD